MTITSSLLPGLFQLLPSLSSVTLSTSESDVLHDEIAYTLSDRVVGSVGVSSYVICVTFKLLACQSPGSCYALISLLATLYKRPEKTKLSHLTYYDLKLPQT